MADTLVIHPMHSAWLTFRRDGDYKSTVSFLNDNLIALTYLLSGEQIAYHFGSETVMRELGASVTGNSISVGRCSYHTVIVPVCDTLDSNTAELLKQFKENGGRIYTYKRHLPTRIDGRPADLSFLDGCEDISDSAVFNELKQSGDVVVTRAENATDRDIRMMVRKTEYGRLIYLTNLSDKEFRGIGVAVKNCDRLGKMRIDDLETFPLAGRKTAEGVEILLDLFGGESAVLCEYDAPDFAPFVTSEASELITFNAPFTVNELPLNMMTLDRAYLSKNGGEFTELRPMERIRDNLLRERFDGNITLAFPFDVRDIPSRLEVITEPMSTDTVRVNGSDVKIGSEWAIDRSFRVTDIAPYVKKGENKIELSLRYWQRDYVYHVLYGGGTETLRNSLVFDTEIENVYIRGNFALDMKKDNFTAEDNNAYRYDPALGMTLVKQKKDIDIRNVVTDGYPFYCGELSATTVIDYKSGDPTALNLTGRYATAHIRVNGRAVDKGIFDQYVDIKEYLREGQNTLTVTLCNNYRNLFGPFHGQPAEPMSVGPKAFSMEKRWEGGRCPLYDGRYSFVRFGIDIQSNV